MNITFHTIVSQKEQEEIRRITEECSQADGVSYSCPLDADGYWLAYEEPDGKRADKNLLAFLAVYQAGDDSWECCAFTRPFARKRRCFSNILRQACKKGQIPGEDPLCFLIDKNWSLSQTVLEHIGAEKTDEEWMMERSLTDLNLQESPFTSLSPELSFQFSTDSLFPETDTLVSAFSPGIASPIGSCQLLFQETFVYLHHFVIVPSLRGKGLGTVFLTGLLPLLKAKGIKAISLQVAKSNVPAVSLYQKTGFHVTETLFSYCY